MFVSDPAWGYLEKHVLCTHGNVQLRDAHFIWERWPTITRRTPVFVKGANFWELLPALISSTKHQIYEEPKDKVSCCMHHLGVIIPHIKYTTMVLVHHAFKGDLQWYLWSWHWSYGTLVSWFLWHASLLSKSVLDMGLVGRSWVWVTKYQRRPHGASC